MCSDACIAALTTSADKNCHIEDDTGTFCSETCKVLRDEVINACPVVRRASIKIAIHISYKSNSRYAWKLIMQS